MQIPFGCCFHWRNEEEDFCPLPTILHTLPPILRYKFRLSFYIITYQNNRLSIPVYIQGINIPTVVYRYSNYQVRHCPDQRSHQYLGTVPGYFANVCRYVYTSRYIYTQSHYTNARYSRCILCCMMFSLIIALYSYMRGRAGYLLYIATRLLYIYTYLICRVLYMNTLYINYSLLYIYNFFIGLGTRTVQQVW